MSDETNPDTPKYSRRELTRLLGAGLLGGALPAVGQAGATAAGPVQSRIVSPDELLAAPMHAMARAIRAGAITSVELTRALLERIEAVNPGLNAIAQDPLFDADWREWILEVRRQIGILDVADMIFVRSQYYVTRVKGRQKDEDKPLKPILFGEKEGRIALANRRKDPLYLFSALQRHLSYPSVPKIERRDPQQDLLPRLTKTVERLEARLKLLEDEQREKGIDLSQFYQPPEPGA